MIRAIVRAQVGVALCALAGGFAGPLVLTGCSLAPGGAAFEAAADAGTDVAIREVQHFDDNALKVFTKGICAVTVGAYGRLQEGRVKRGLALICDIHDDAAASTQAVADALDRLQRTLNALDRRLQQLPPAPASSSAPRSLLPPQLQGQPAQL
jgi:hypothetical protein